MSDPVTSNLGLTLPVAHEPDWNTPLNGNFTLIDTFAGTTVELNPAASQTITNSSGTFTNMNAPFVFGTTPILGFGVTAGTLGGCLTMATAGNFTLDDATPGDAAGNLKLAKMNAVTGYQYNGAAPTGHVLMGNGTEYIDGQVYNQTVEAAGTPLPQRSKLNFLAPMSVADDSGNASTDVGLTATGVAGTYVNPNLTLDDFGLVTAVTGGGTVRTTNANGTYRIGSDGTIEQWGFHSVTNATFTFPIAFTTACQAFMASNSNSMGTFVDAAYGAPTSLTQFFLGTKDSQGGLSNFPCYWYAIGF